MRAAAANHLTIPMRRRRRIVAGSDAWPRTVRSDRRRGSRFGIDAGPTWPASGGTGCAAATPGTCSTTPSCNCGSGSPSRRERRGLEVETDRNGNIWAWWGAPGPGAVVTGSHLDSVPGGGAFDGPLGVVSGAAGRRRAAGCAGSRRPGRWPIACFAEEEGGRFGLPCMGSRLMTGAVDADRCGGCTTRMASRWPTPPGAAGLDPGGHGPGPGAAGQHRRLRRAARRAGQAAAAADPTAVVGVGIGIVAHGRWRITVTGQGNHAGTTRAGRPPGPDDSGRGRACSPPAGRSREHDGAVATVGRISPIPGGTNVIASRVELWLDVRHDTAPR